MCHEIRILPPVLKVGSLNICGIDQVHFRGSVGVGGCSRIRNWYGVTTRQRTVYNITISEVDNHKRTRKCP